MQVDDLKKMSIASLEGAIREFNRQATNIHDSTYLRHANGPDGRREQSRSRRELEQLTASAEEILAELNSRGRAPATISQIVAPRRNRLCFRKPVYAKPAAPAEPKSGASTDEKISI